MFVFKGLQWSIRVLFNIIILYKSKRIIFFIVYVYYYVSPAFCHPLLALCRPFFNVLLFFFFFGSVFIRPLAFHRDRVNIINTLYWANSLLVQHTYAFYTAVIFYLCPIIFNSSKVKKISTSFRSNGTMSRHVNCRRHRYCRPLFGIIRDVTTQALQ